MFVYVYYICIGSWGWGGVGQCRGFFSQRDRAWGIITISIMYSYKYVHSVYSVYLSLSGYHLRQQKSNVKRMCASRGVVPSLRTPYYSEPAG